MLADAAQSGGTQSPFSMLGFLIPMLVIMYFLMIRPQQKKAKEHALLLTKLKSGDRVVTSSGIVGMVIAVKDKTVTLRTAGDTKLEFTKGSVVEITATGSDSSEA